MDCTSAQVIVEVSERAIALKAKENEIYIGREIFPTGRNSTSAIENLMRGCSEEFASVRDYY